MKNINKDCICSEWDGKGWSVCGVPCPTHNKMNKKELKKVFDKRKEMFLQFAKDIKSGKYKKQEVPF